MTIFFEEKDLIEFGEYLLSDERKNALLTHPDFKDKTEDDLKYVYETDLYKFYNKGKQ